ncbi:MAG: hypothetical protein M1368_09410 [Thaumarchaeota archaeon]|nr:hypothetical protein [Nitrososphaerota archaeon]MDG6997413.1 hypothetical protein [Nitrososphaerota archaeon]
MGTDKKESEASSVAGELESELVEALANKHSQLDINFQKTGVRILGMQQLGIELNGVVTFTVHMRDLTEEEKKASASKNVALMATQ